MGYWDSITDESGYTYEAQCLILLVIIFLLAVEWYFRYHRRK